eukprot:m.148436 g.148436  ORF g.148436 m.148436 type:complete len:325 (-) comp30596_c0_seq1:406-1380(-)
MFKMLLLSSAVVGVFGFHDCIQHPSTAAKRHALLQQGLGLGAPPPLNCSGGLCVGMHNGPHEGGPASYPVGNAQEGYTDVYSTMTVPEQPDKIDGITYYIWSDIFFGDVGYGHMNQFVPQLILGSALDSSSGPPLFDPMWHTHQTWMFGAHYFFEVFNATANATQGKAAYGKLYPAKAGETLFTSFTQSKSSKVDGTAWTLKMGVVGDADRTSVVVVDQPYMGLGENWPVPTKTWNEANYSRMCINSCWELYGAVDRAHLPNSGSTYNIQITRGEETQFPWVKQWDEDEGLGKSCATSTIAESHNGTAQNVLWKISSPQKEILP